MKKKNKILIFGKKSFIGHYLHKKLKKNYNVFVKDFNRVNLKNINSYNYIINCSTNKDYIYNKYSEKNDHDLAIIKKIKNEKIIFIFLGTRMIYKPKSNITELSKIECKNNYAKNKFITEKEIINIRPNGSVILRISNLIGYKNRNYRQVHNTYIDYFLNQISKKNLIDNKNCFKDFLDITTFTKILHLIIKKKVIGTYNISIGKKIYLNEINKWLLHYYKKKDKLKIKYNKKKQHSFYLNNTKIKKILNIKIDIGNLKLECYRISKILFYKPKKL